MEGLKRKGVTICGIEIDPTAEPVDTLPFRGPTAFIPGHEAEGLSAEVKALCDHFVYVRQYRPATASVSGQ